MKRLLITWLLALMAGAPIFADSMPDGHVLTSLWKQYEAASKADLPQQEADILSKIKQEAIAQHLPVDFYDAATAYVACVQRRDWKQRDKLRSDLEQEVKAFDEPIVTFLWMQDQINASSERVWSYVQQHLDGFQGNHPALHRNVEGLLGGALQHFIGSDKEYILWRIMPRRSFQNFETNEIYLALKEEVAGKYPNAAALEYVALSNHYYPDSKRDQKMADFSALAERYAGKAISVFPQSTVLFLRKEQLEEKKASSDDFRALYADAKKLEKERQAYKGEEAILAQGTAYPKNLCEQLTASGLEIEVEDGDIFVIFRNLDKASVTLRKGEKALNTKEIVNKTCSFYVKDSVRIKKPQLADGEYIYEAVNGKLSDQAGYTQLTLSLATRLDSRGHCVYVADYASGKPLSSATIVLKKGDKKVASAKMNLDGFTPLPKSLAKYLKKDDVYYQLVAEYGNRLSPWVGIDEYWSTDPDTGPHCNLYLDRGAYNPGDTLQFKAVMYEGDPMLKLGVCADKKLKIKLFDSEGNELESLEKRTSTFGSVSGSFVLPKGLRNGMFRLSVEGYTSKYFRVDEFVLPSFDLSFDKWEKLYLPGDEVPISGRLTSYSGHKLTGARIAIKVASNSLVVFEAEEEVADDNSFLFTVPVANSGYYGATVTVTDATGETLSFDNTYYISNTIRVQLTVDNTADAELDLPDDKDDGRFYYRRKPKYVIQDQKLSFTLQAQDAQSRPVALPVDYVLTAADGAIVAKGQANSGEKVELTLPEDGLYLLHSEAEVLGPREHSVKGESDCRIYCAPADCKALKPSATRLFISGPQTVEAGMPIKARLGSAAGTAYTVITVFGKDGEVLETKRLNSANEKLTDLSIPYKITWPDAVRLQVFYFRNGGCEKYDREFRRAKTRYTLPLQFTRFHNNAYPGTEYTFTLQTGAGVEALAAAWDKSMDAIAMNHWPEVSMRDYSVRYVDINAANGYVADEFGRGDYVPMVYGARMKGGDVLMEAAPMLRANAVADVAEAEEASDDSADLLDDVSIRSDFSSALTFQPHLVSAADGTLQFSFRTSDKLSTYYVRVYAHDVDMRNALVEDLMVVSLPVKVSLLEPRYLYEGDVYEAALTVSSMTDVPVSGILGLRIGSSNEQQLPLTVNPGETATHRFLVPVSAAGDLTLTAFFKADAFSDAVQVTVPVYPATQELTEAHSAVLLDGADREALLADLRSRFVNVPAAEAQLKEITVLDMVRDAIPTHVDPDGNDVLSLSEAWYVRLMAGRLSMPAEAADSAELLDKILACRNADGGFAWFEGMSSSPMMTAVLLERFAKLRDRGFEVPSMASSVRYLDRTQFSTTLPLWRGWLSDAQYLRVRAMYPEVAFQVSTVTKADEKRMTEFRKWAKDYLTPSKKDGRGLKGQILAKARRLLTLNDLTSREGGIALAKAWGVDVSTAKLKKSLKADVASLVEYAVEHRDGGWYYPNAVMPWRGLLESEAYAHSLLCDLLWTVSGDKTAAIADGIRLWLMLQKETQEWDSEPAYIDAITSILDGSEAMLSTRVLALSATYRAPFLDVKAAGNGFTVQRKCFREGAAGALEELQPGDSVQVGDKIVVKYWIWNAENRSFVKLTAGREATLRPEQQLSGYLGWSIIHPLRNGISWGFVPQGYRNVKADVTEYYFDSYPEENTELTESFYVTQAGKFSAPVTVIESLYAPHYRANSEALPPLEPSAR